MTLGTKIAHTYNEGKIAKWDKKNDRAHGLIGMSISLNLIFHCDGLDFPIKAWEKLNIVFGLKNDI